jgi:hypothetical protein
MEKQQFTLLPSSEVPKHRTENFLFAYKQQQQEFNQGYFRYFSAIVVVVGISPVN